MRELKCLYCGTAMEFNGIKELQMGHEDLVVDTHYWSGSLKMAMYECPNCGKYDFFKPDEEEIDTYEIKIEKIDRSELRKKIRGF